MTGKTISRLIAMASLVATLLLAFSVEAKAQLDGTLTISNNVNCQVTVCLSNGDCITLFPGSTIRVNVPCSQTTVAFISCGLARKISLGDCLSAINVGTCCADVCYSPGIVACTSFLSFNPTTQRCRPCPSDSELE